MSLLVLHMDKFKKDAVRGIQSHNRRERESHSNPDIDYGRSVGNYDLCDNPSTNYGQSIQNRIDDLLMVKAVRKDAVHMCGLVVSSDKEFFDKLTPEETRRFFEEAKEFLTKFVGKENVISAMVHMDERTPHMHFLHVPITKDGRLCAKDIYTKVALKKLQDEMPKFLLERGFLIERGVEQKQGSAKKHLATKEFKQQQEFINTMQAEADSLRGALKKIEEQITAKEQEENKIDEKIALKKEFVEEAEEKLKTNDSIRPANFFNYKEVLAEAQELIATLKAALLGKRQIEEEIEMRRLQAQNLLNVRNEAIAKANEAIRIVNKEREQFAEAQKKWQQALSANSQELEAMRSFILLNGFVERFREFVRSLKEAPVRHQSKISNSSGSRRLR